jgi:hypothetical protein
MAISGKAMDRAFLNKRFGRFISGHPSDKQKLFLLSLIALLISMILIADLLIPQASLGILYVIPMLLGPLVLRERQTALLALFCAIFSCWGDSSANRVDAALYFLFSFISYLAVAYFMTMLLRNHRMVAPNLQATNK